MVKLPENVREFFRNKGAQGGRSTARKRTSKQRSEAARKAVNARWAKYRAPKRKSEAGERSS